MPNHVARESYVELLCQFVDLWVNLRRVLDGFVALNMDFQVWIAGEGDRAIESKLNVLTVDQDLLNLCHLPIYAKLKFANGLLVVY